MWSLRIFGAPGAVCPECQPVPHAQGLALELPKSIDTALKLLTPVSNASVVDDQAFADFFSVYIPPEVGAFRQSYLIALADYVPRTPILQRAKHTLGLAHLASSVDDDRLSQRCRVEYGRILAELRFRLYFPSKLQSRTDFRELVASIALLSHLGDPIVNSIDADDSWATHLWGIQHVFAGRIPSDMFKESMLDRGLVRHTLMNGFLLALAKRKTWVIDPRWFPAISQGWTSVLMVFHELPSLLERVDRALTRKSDVQSLLQIIARLRKIREIALQLPELGLNTPPDLVDARRLNTDVEEHSVMAQSTVFPKLYLPDTSPNGYSAFAALHWRIPMMMLECSLLRIWSFVPDTFNPIFNAWQRNVERNAYNLARVLCLSVLSFTQPDKLVRAMMLRLMLKMAMNVFEQRVAGAETEWCRACLEANEVRVQRIRGEGGPTLCKIEDVVPGIVESCRYKSLFETEAFVVRAREAPRRMSLTI